MQYLDMLTKQFNNSVAITPRKTGVYQLDLPYYYEDGDMVSVFIEELPGNGVRICDYGVTMMRLSYSTKMTPNKRKMLNNIINENLGDIDDGNIYIDTVYDNIYPSLLQYSQIIAKVSNLSILNREYVKSLFFEDLYGYINDKLSMYHPMRDYNPMTSRQDLTVNCAFLVPEKKPIYLFGVKDSSTANDAIISCLEFIKASVNFKSLVVCEDSEVLSKKDRVRLTNAADKQYTNLLEFKANAPDFFKREIA